MHKGQSVRLQKYLASCGFGSRRYCEELIAAGRVAVDGHVVRTQGNTIDPHSSEVLVDGSPVSSQKRVYILLNKPRGVVVTCMDPEGRRTISEILPDLGVRLYHVGRLDRDSEGALILTNDGEFANLLTHPRNQVDKTYMVWADGELTSDQVRMMKNGIMSLGEKLNAADVARAGKFRYALVMRHGKKREIRRMFEYFDLKVLRLQRTAIGALKLGSLNSGAWRYLTEKEIAMFGVAARRAR